MLFSTRQHRLHETTLVLDDMRFDGASLFPFFDREGAIQGLMITRGDDSEILLAPWRPNLVRVRLWQPTVVHLRRADCLGFEALEFDRLWHFDPWWELGEARYAGHPLVPPIKDTNLPGHDERWTQLWFSFSTGRVSWMATGEGESMQAKRFRPALMNKAVARRGHARPFQGRHDVDSDRSVWRLRPFW